MNAAWAKNYIGLPFRWRGRDRSGVDCYGLVCLVYAEQFGIHLPSLDDAEASAFMEPRERAAIIDTQQAAGYWRHVHRPEHGDVVLLRLSGFPAHLGLYVGHEKFIHSIETANVCMERLDSPLWRNRILGYYRYQEGAA